MARRGRWLAASMLVLLAIGACDPDATPTPGPSQAVTGQAPGADDPLPVRQPANLSWVDLGQPPGGVVGWLEAVSTRYVAWSINADHALLVRRRSDNELVLRHSSAGPSWVIALADLAGDRLVVVEEDQETDGDGVKDRAQAFVYELATGTRTQAAGLPGLAPVSEFGAQGIVTDDGRYIYSASVTRPHNRYINCVGMLNLETLRGSTLECAGDGQNEMDGLYVFESQDGAAWLHVQGPTIESCRTGHGVRGSKLTILGPADGCATLAATSIDDWSVWSSSPLPAGAPIPHVPLRASDGNRTLHLGMVDGVSVIRCGVWVYWRTSDDASRTIQLRRWRPGSTFVERAYQVDLNDGFPTFQLALKGCADGMLALYIPIYTANGQESRNMALDSLR